MAVDRGYGSGKPRSAANSRARQRVAKDQMTKGKKGNAALKKIAAENPITGFIGGGILPAKLIKAASALTAAGQISKAIAVRSRLAARIEGRTLSGNVNDVAMRNQSLSVFPRATSSTKASPRLQKVADTITKRHYADVAKKGVGHDVAVNMPRAQVLRNLKAKRGIQINKPR